MMANAMTRPPYSTAEQASRGVAAGVTPPNPPRACAGVLAPLAVFLFPVVLGACETAPPPQPHAGISEFTISLGENRSAHVVDGKERRTVSFSYESGDTKIAYAASDVAAFAGQEIQARVTAAVEATRGQTTEAIVAAVLAALAGPGQ